MKRGRRSFLTPNQAALLHELQVQSKTAKRAIRAILDEAGYSADKENRRKVLLRVWRAGGVL